MPAKSSPVKSSPVKSSPVKSSKVAKATPAEDAAEKAPTAKAAKKAAPTKTAPAKAVRPQPAPAAPATDDGGDEAEEFVPMNRAERRAKGRGKSIAQAPGGRGKVSGGHGPAHTFRNWASRRTG